MNILFVYPETPSTFWSFRNALEFISKKSSEPPLGLITVAALLPGDWQKKLIDMNVSPLNDEDILWADYLFLTGMNIHKHSFNEVVQRANRLGVKVVAGGPMVTSEPESFSGISHFILHEAEITLPLFIKDLLEGNPQAVYSTDHFPDITATPPPQWELLEMEKYASMSIQYSRGCPFDCEFCSITLLNGHKPRTKDSNQFLNELESLYDSGWRGDVFVVDDNFIGNKKKLKKELLPAIIDWSRQHHQPFTFATEVSINVADDPELLRLMTDAGFDHAFIGIETPNDASLNECGKKQNLKHDMLQSIKTMHRAGLRVSGGFIIGFDNDPVNIFDQHIDFIKNSGIVTAMVGLLNAPTGTRLFQRLKKENRLLNSMTGDNMDGSINFIPKMNYAKLMAGYKKVLRTIYSPKTYYARVKQFLEEFEPKVVRAGAVNLTNIKALLRSIWILGIREKGKLNYWKLFFSTLFRRPRKFPLAITMAVYGFHFRQIIRTI